MVYVGYLVSGFGQRPYLAGARFRLEEARLWDPFGDLPLRREGISSPLFPAVGWPSFRLGSSDLVSCCGR